MRRLKLLVVLLFLVTVLTLFFNRLLLSPVVSGQTATTLAAPTGFAASDNSYSNRIGLTWDAVRGATSYRIFRSTVNDAATATSIGTTAASALFDGTAIAGQQYFYWVRAENGNIVSDLSQSDAGLRGVGNDGNRALFPPFAPPGNPVTAAKATLGKTLFWDEQLSSTRTAACGTCHSASSGGSDSRSIFGSPRSLHPGVDNVFGTADDVTGSPGVISSNADGTYNWSPTFGFREQVTNHKARSFVDSGYGITLFWDGNAGDVFSDPLTGAVVLPNNAALESQVLSPFLNSTEMAYAGRSWLDVTSRISSSKPLALAPTVPESLTEWIDGRSYPELFEEAFGTSEITPVRIAMAIATYERTLYSDRTPFDAAISGIDSLNEQEQRGQIVFNQNQCSGCHIVGQLTNNQFHYIGVRPANEDPGRFQVTNNLNDLGKFRTPNLRNVGLRAPYFHNGQFATLEEVVAFYNRGGDFDAPNKDPRIHPRNLSAQQQADLVAFLKRPLTDPRVAANVGQFSRPTLYSESSRVPQIFGRGTRGTSGLIPQPTAVEPPILGNPSFTVGVSNALGGATAILVVNSTDPGTRETPANGSFSHVTVQLSGSGAGNGYGSVSLPIPNDPALVNQTFFGRWYVSDANGANGTAVSPAFRFTVFGEAATTGTTHSDFDGDGKTDIAVWRPNASQWWILQSSNNTVSVATFGLQNDRIAPGDYDGDGKTDIAVFRDGVWYIQKSREGFSVVGFGLAGDRPQPGDYDGDGRYDIAVWRPSDRVWYIQRSTDGFTAAQFGLSTDRPVAADYDGDGKTDVAVYRDGVWYLLRSTAGFAAIQFGVGEDKPVIGDYDNDNKTDLAVWRPSTGVWYALNSSNGGFRANQFGISTDTPAPGDYDGDGKFDYAVFRASEGIWYIMQNANYAVRIQNWGTAGDVSIPTAIVP